MTKFTEHKPRQIRLTNRAYEKTISGFLARATDEKPHARHRNEIRATPRAILRQYELGTRGITDLFTGYYKNLTVSETKFYVIFSGAK